MRLLLVESGPSRVGFVVPKHGQTAVRRNKLKRRLREWVRVGLLPALAAGEVHAVDIVIRARQSAYDAPVAALHEELDKMVSSVIRFTATRG
jgi:ribonuclease P protein component